MRRTAFTQSWFGFVFCLVGFIFFQGLLFGLVPLVQREFVAQSLNSQLSAYIAPTFLHARIWLGVVLFLLLAVVRYFDFGRPSCGAVATMAIFIVFAYLLVVVRALQFPICIDDAYIDFRHARNLVLHGSLDYNLGDPVMGFTSHLHLWILSLLGAVVGFDALPLWSQNFNILCDLLSFGLIYQLSRRLQLAPLASVISSGLFALLSYQYLSTIDGKEASLLILLLLVLIFSIETNRLAGVAWGSVLIFLIRPEGVIVAALAGCWVLRFHGFRPLKYWILPGLVAAFWYGLLLYHFGTIWPQGMVAKSVVYVHPSAVNVAARILSFLAESFGCNNGNYYEIMNVQGGTFMVLILPLIVWALWRSPGARFYLVALVLISAAFMVKKVELAPFPWYFAWYALVPILVIPFIFEQAIDLAKAAGRFRGLLVAGAAGFVALLPLNSCGRTKAGLLGVNLPYPFFAWGYGRERLLDYRDLAHRIQQAAGNTAVVAVSEDGMFGYTYDGPILTLDGLAFRDVRRYYPLPAKMLAENFAISPSLVSDQKPEYVVFLEIFGRNSLLKDEAFIQQYTLLQSLDAKAFHSEGMFLYQRRPAPAANPAPTN